MKTGNDLIRDIDNYNLHKGKMVFWWIGQHSFVIKLNNNIIYIDPFLSNRPDRNIPPLLKPEEIHNAQLILGTHDHDDHIDKGIWPSLALSSPQSKFIIPKALIKALSDELHIPANRFIGLDDGSSVDVSGIKITGIAAAHEFLDKDVINDCYPYLGYVIESKDCVIYHSGDTCIYEGLQSKLKRWKRIDVMFLPINGRDGKRLKAGCIGNMTYQEAVDLAGTLNPELIVPAHYEMFNDNMENPALFAEYMDVKYPFQKYWIGEHGQAVLLK